MIPLALLAGWFIGDFLERARRDIEFTGGWLTTVSGEIPVMVMLSAVVILLPMVVAYTGWAYSVMRGKVTKAYIREQDHTVY